jgi:long-chain acyl-CoA synthetase
MTHPLLEALRGAVQRGADSPAVTANGQSWTLTELLTQAERVGDWLAGIVPAQAPVLFVPSNTPSSVAFILGAIARSRLPVLADPAWTDAELQLVMERSSIGTLASEQPAAKTLDGRYDEWGGFRAITDGRKSRPCGSPVAFARFTSGSTGAARCLGFTESAALGAARGWGAAAGYGPSDRVLCLATLNNGLAFNAALFAVLLSGAELVFHTGPLLPRAIARTIQVFDPTVLVAFPFVYGQVTKNETAAKTLARLRLAVSSAARLAPELKQAWSRVSPAPMCDYYGLVEVGPCTFNDGADPDSVGRVLPGVSVRVTDGAGRSLARGESGRLRVRTESMASEFLDDDEPRITDSVDEDGYYVTRDIGYFDDHDRLHLTGREGRQINIEGRKVEPAEIEDVLRAIEGVREAVVVAEEGATRPRLAAYLEASGLTRAEVTQVCASRLAPYKIPQRIEVLDRLPRSSTGKVSVGRLTTSVSREVDE